jgi:hypothetical protein
MEPKAIDPVRGAARLGNRLACVARRMLNEMAGGPGDLSVMSRVPRR